MTLPTWVFFLVGAMVIVFGAYRIRLAFRPGDEEQAAIERGGLYGLKNRTHLLFGVVYILMGLILVLTGAGFDVLHFRRR